MLKIGIEDVDGELLKGGGGITKNDKASLTAKDSPIPSANKPINGQGMSAAARAWEKHAGREGETFEPLKGNVAQRMNLRFSELQKSLERAKGIEPSYRAWEALVLPLNYARKGVRGAL